jgi:hypothetical protein
MEEVSRYAMVAAEIALRYDFDVIHAHDWLTYLAGTAAKGLTGKTIWWSMFMQQSLTEAVTISTQLFTTLKNWG